MASLAVGSMANTARLATVDQKSYHMMSVYEMKTDQLRQTSVMQFVHGFDQNVWLLTLILLLFFATIMTAATLLRRRSPVPATDAMPHEL